MSAAEEIRRAAETLRERAEAVAFGTEDPWYGDPDTVSLGAPAVDAAYIATLHPGVGLAVADWLDHQAYEFDRYMNRQMDPTRRFNSLWLTKAQDEHADALAVARQINGESSD